MNELACNKQTIKPDNLRSSSLLFYLAASHLLLTLPQLFHKTISTSGVTDVDKGYLEALFRIGGR
jgi:hypothetical protein